MNCFELIKQVLDDEYEKIPSENRDALINARLPEIREEFRNCGASVNVDYDDAVTRFAYVYKYTTAHAMFLHLLIEATPELSAVFDRTFQAAAIGGGPGSDLLGILKYMHEHQKSSRAITWLIDYTKAWETTWSTIFLRLPEESGVTLQPSFRQVDICDRAMWSSEDCYFDADLYTLMFFISQMFCRRNECSEYFHHLFQRMKSGAIVVFIDNSGHRIRFHEWFDTLTDVHDFTRVASSDAHYLRCPDEEQKRALGDYLGQFSEVPKVKQTVSFRVLRKN